MPSLGWKRRDFCLKACRTVSAVTIVSALHGCGSDSPTAPSQPPPTGTTPPPQNPTPPTNPPDAPPTNPTPPPPSPIVSPLPTVSAALMEGALAVTVNGSPLATLWGAGLAQVVVGGIERSVLLARIGPEAFTALNGVCTHEGCVVSRYASPIFVCPCHGSRYDINGSVVQGPAPAALPRLTTEYVDGVLRVRL